MRFAVTSEDFRTVSPHAGHVRRFLIYEVGPYDQVLEIERRELAEELMFAVWHGQGPHPLDDVDVLIAGSFGAPFGAMMEKRGILAVATTRTDPLDAIHAFLEAGGVPAFAPPRP
jgi:predicted Fe-Mo cluster-binding NifX family protein